MQDCESLQADLHAVYSWAKAVNMHFNCDKFECLRIWPGSGNAPDYSYNGPDGSDIEVKNNLKDLGIYISSDLTFKYHVEKIVTGASKLTGWGLRSFRRRSQSVMKAIWQSLIQPKIDYCIQLWSTGDQDSISKLESIQRHFTSKIKNMEGPSYWERLSVLRLYSQERRRERYMVLFLSKVSQGMVGGYKVDFSRSLRWGRLVIGNPMLYWG